MAWTRRQFLSVATVLATAGCAQEISGSPRKDPAARPPEPVPEIPQLTVGIIAYPPYTIEDGDDLTGPVPDVARAVLERLGVGEVRFLLMRQPEQLLPALLSGSVDLGAGMAIRPDLCGGVSFTVPDHVSGTAFAVPVGNPKGLSTYADVITANAKLAVWQSLPEDTDAVRAGVPAANLVRLNDPVALLGAVEAGQADCFAFDDLSLRELAREHAETLEVAEPFMPDGRLPLIGAYCFAKTNEDLLPSFNNALRDLHESGDWGAMVAPYGLTEFNAPPEDLTVEQACAG